MKHLGITATRTGLTSEQSYSAEKVVAEYDVIHHGDCLGGDLQMHLLAYALGKKVVVHPPDNQRLRAFCSSDDVRPTRPYMSRNRDIVKESEVLLAMPLNDIEDFVSGTWATVRLARKAGRKIIIIRQDGSIVMENPA